MNGFSQSERDRQIPPVVIIGAHRSGTTATTRALRILGLQIGERLDSHEEPRELRQLHDRYLKDTGASWHEPTAFLNSAQTPEGFAHCRDYLRHHLRENFPQVFGYRKNLLRFPRRAHLNPERPWGWKEPRTTLFAACWLDIFPGARILHVVRHPLAVAASLQRRELDFQAKGDPPTGRVHDFAYCLDLAAIYMEAGRTVGSQAEYYQRARFEDIQTDPIKTLSTLADFCGLAFTAEQMAEAAASIRAEKSKAWRNLPNAGELLSKHPVAAALGYSP